MFLFALLFAVAWAQTPTNPTCCGHSYWTGRCTGCPGYWYQTCNSGYSDADQRGCGFLGCETKCYNSCRYKNYGCGCNNGTSCHNVNCVVSGWSTWGSCSKNCGGGIQTRTREIKTNAAYGGTACPPASSLTESKPCNIQSCVVDCKVGDFGEFGECSATCGGGIKKQTRSITTAAANGGAACPPLENMQPCNLQSCPVDCEVGDFGAWGDCSVTCGGGIQKRKRSITTDAAHGGNACPALEEEQECITQSCTVDCAVGPFGEFGECSASCGGGIKKRTRSVTTAAANGGAACPPLDEMQPCNFQSCPVATPAPVADPSTPAPVADPSTPAPVAAKCPVQLVSTQRFATTVKAKGKGKRLKAADVDALSCACETMCKEDAKSTFWYLSKIKKGKQGSCSCLEGDSVRSFKKSKKTIKGAVGGLTEDARAKVTEAMNASSRRRRRRGRGRRRN